MAGGMGCCASSSSRPGAVFIGDVIDSIRTKRRAAQRGSEPPLISSRSVFGLARTLGGSEQLAWTLQRMVSGTVVVSVVMLWRSRADYALKAAALAAGTQLLTPYLFLTT